MASKNTKAYHAQTRQAAHKNKNDRPEQAQAALAAMLANLDIRGQVELPTDEAACAEWHKAIEKRISEARSRFEDLAVYRSDMERLREEIVAVLLQWFIHGWE